MKNAIMAVLAFWLGLYLVASFVAWNFNAGEWTSDARYFLALLAVILGGFLAFAAKETGND